MMSNFKLKLVSNIDEVLPLVKLAATQAKALKKSLKIIKKFNLKIGTVPDKD